MRAIRRHYIHICIYPYEYPYVCIYPYIVYMHMYMCVYICVHIYILTNGKKIHRNKFGEEHLEQFPLPRSQNTKHNCYSRSKLENKQASFFKKKNP